MLQYLKTAGQSVTLSTAAQGRGGRLGRILFSLIPSGTALACCRVRVCQSNGRCVHVRLLWQTPRGTSENIICMRPMAAHWLYFESALSSRRWTNLGLMFFVYGSPSSPPPPSIHPPPLLLTAHSPLPSTLLLSFLFSFHNRHEDVQEADVR